MSWSGRDTLPNVRDDFSDVREWSGDPLRFVGVVGMPYQMSGTHFWKSRSGRDALPDVQELSGDPPRCLEVVGRTFRMSGSGREAPADVLEWS